MFATTRLEQLVAEVRDIEQKAAREGWALDKDAEEYHIGGTTQETTKFMKYVKLVLEKQV